MADQINMRAGEVPSLSELATEALLKDQGSKSMISKIFSIIMKPAPTNHKKLNDENFALIHNWNHLKYDLEDAYTANIMREIEKSILGTKPSGVDADRFLQDQVRTLFQQLACALCANKPVTGLQSQAVAYQRLEDEALQQIWQALRKTMPNIPNFTSAITIRSSLDDFSLQRRTRSSAAEKSSRDEWLFSSGSVAFISLRALRS